MEKRIVASILFCFDFDTREAFLISNHKDYAIVLILPTKLYGVFILLSQPIYGLAGALISFNRENSLILMVYNTYSILIF